jgi:FG-GAP-like repeat
MMIPRILLIVGLCAVVGTDAAEASICPPICAPHPPCWPHCHSHTDIALVGSFGGLLPPVDTIPVARSNGDGTFVVINGNVGDFLAWSQAPGVVVLTGDFDGDGFTDIALTGAPNWNTIPIAFSNGDGTFHVTNVDIGPFATWATGPHVTVVTGDFDNDGKTDIALIGTEGDKLPVAFSLGDGGFHVTTSDVDFFAAWARMSGATALAGDYNHDGRTDIALTGHAGWNTLPVAFSNGDGTFKVSNTPIDVFAAWAATPGVIKLVGDFDGDGRDDIALPRLYYWTTIPVAFSMGNGSFSVTNMSIPLNEAGGPTKLTGDFNGDGRTDIAMFGDDWNPFVLFHSTGDGGFSLSSQPADPPPAFYSWLLQPGAVPLLGDFDGDGRTDFAIIGGVDWGSLPVVFSKPNGLLTATYAPIDDFASWAANPAAVKLTGHFTHD